MAKGTSRDGSKTKSTKKETARKHKPAQQVIAAGAVLWRPDPDSGQPRVAVIHRPRYDDWSLPKGKLEDRKSVV